MSLTSQSRIEEEKGILEDENDFGAELGQINGWDFDITKLWERRDEVFEFDCLPEHCTILNIQFSMLNSFILTSKLCLIPADGRVFSSGGFTECLGWKYSEE